MQCSHPVGSNNVIGLKPRHHITARSFPRSQQLSRLVLPKKVTSPVIGPVVVDHLNSAIDVFPHLSFSTFISAHGSWHGMVRSGPLGGAEGICK